MNRKMFLALLLLLVVAVFSLSPDYASAEDDLSTAISFPEREQEGLKDSDFVQFDTLYTGNLQDKQDTDYYYFKLNEPGKVKIKLRNHVSKKWYIYLTDGESNSYDRVYSLDGVVVRDDGIEYTEKEIGLPAGTYYFFLGPYKLSCLACSSTYFNLEEPYYFQVSYEAGDYFEKEFNNDKISANNIEFDQTYKGAIQNQGGSYGESDYYRFQTNETGGISLSIRNSAEHQWNVSIEDSNGKSYGSYTTITGVEVKDNGPVFTHIDQTLPEGTYYIRISGDEAPYSFIVKENDVTPPVIASVYEITDATRLITGKTEANADVNIEIAGKFITIEKADKDGYFSIEITPPKAGSTVRVQTRDSAGNKSKPVYLTVKATDARHKDAEKVGSTVRMEMKKVDAAIQSGDIAKVDSLYDDLSYQIGKTERVIGKVSGKTRRTHLLESYVRPAKIARERVIYEVSQLRLMRIIQDLQSDGQYDKAQSAYEKLGRLKKRAVEIKKAGGYEALPNEISETLLKMEEEILKGF